jgi:hypothetical protein
MDSGDAEGDSVLNDAYVSVLGSGVEDAAKG